MKTTNFRKDTNAEIETMFGLLRQVYDIVEMSHLTDHKMTSMYCKSFRMQRSLAERIYGYLQAKDQTFRDKVIKRQNRFIKRQNKLIKTYYDVDYFTNTYCYGDETIGKLIHSVIFNSDQNIAIFADKQVNAKEYFRRIKDNLKALPKIFGVTFIRDNKLDLELDTNSRITAGILTIDSGKGERFTDIVIINKAMINKKEWREWSEAMWPCLPKDSNKIIYKSIGELI